MEEIIKQIVQIDSVAMGTRKSNEETLRLKKEQYEKEMSAYKEEVISKARQRAGEVYEQIVGAGMQNYQLEEEKCKQSALAIENRYLQVEECLLGSLFNEIFKVEG